MNGSNEVGPKSLRSLQRAGVMCPHLLQLQCWYCCWWVRNFSLAAALLRLTWGVWQAAAISFHPFPNDLIHEGGFIGAESPSPTLYFLKRLNQR